MKKEILCGICILLFITGATCMAFASMKSQSFRITTSVISGGGSAISSDNFQINSTLGQPSPLSPDALPDSENFVLSPGFWYTIDIIPAGEITLAMNFPEGWNMISLPVMPDSSATSQEVFPGAMVIYGYERGTGYVRVRSQEELKFGTGYWIFLKEDKEFTIAGQSVNGYPLSVNEPGWKMIGGCTLDAKATTPENCDIGVIYGYVQGSGYQKVQDSENLKPWNGYWIHLNNLVGQCQLTIGPPGPGF